MTGGDGRSAGSVTTRENGYAANNVGAWGLAPPRVVAGRLFFIHGQQKLSDQGIASVEEFSAADGIPAARPAAVGATFVEMTGGLALVVGLVTRVAGLLLAVDMVVALLVVHAANGFFADEGGIELVLLLAAAALALVLTGPGAAALDALLPVECRLRARAATAPGGGRV